MNRVTRGSFYVSLVFIAGCATSGMDNRTFTGVTKDSGVSVSSGQASAVIYRKTTSGIAVGVKVFIDGNEVANIGHDQFKIVSVPSGLREVRVAGGGDFSSCTKTLFIEPSEVNFLRLGPNADYSTALAIIFPLGGLIKDKVDENRTRCGGTVEPFLVREPAAKQEMRQ
jgi:hypothetical protein